MSSNTAEMKFGSTADRGSSSKSLTKSQDSLLNKKK